MHRMFVVSCVFVLVNFCFSTSMLLREPFRQFGRTLARTSIATAPRPILYVYDHCPFCIRVRLALGIKGIPHALHFLANDDVDTPTKLVGNKITPIFEVPGKVSPRPESLDIIKLVDSDPAYGEANKFKPASGRTDLRDWQQSVADDYRLLQRPRIAITNFAEFASVSGRNAFIRNHPLPAARDITEWRSLTDEERWRVYEQTYEDSIPLIDRTNKALQQLERMLHSTDYCTEGGLSYDDIDLWPRLRLMTLVKGAVIPDKVAVYMQNLSENGDVPLLYSMAC